MQTDKQCGAPIDRNEGCDVIDVPIQVGAQLKHTMFTIAVKSAV